jgi:hypothetical protein
VSLSSKPLELVDELKGCFAPDAGEKGRAVVTTAALLKSFVNWETVM